MLKRCFKCNEVKPLDEFYRHPQMGDGRLNKCKVCAKADVQSNYSQRREQYRRYDRERETRSERRKAKRIYERNYRRSNPLKYAAHTAVSNALRDGRLQKKPCEVCGTTKRVEGHHTDYSKPLEVTWLCFAHHRADHGQKAA